MRTLEWRTGTIARRVERVERGGARGPKGERGPIGPMPKHEVDETHGDVRIRFEYQPDQWGQWHNIQGPKGDKGERGPRGYTIGGGGSTTTTTTTTADVFAAIVPTYIAPGETFVVPANKQMTFATNIDCEGILDCSGMLIEVN